MVIALLLLTFLFIFSLINIYFYVPSKQFYERLQSLFIKKNIIASNISDDPSQISHTKERNMSATSSTSSEKAAGDDHPLKSVFATFDKNGDGFITKQELRESLKNIKILVTEKDVEDMVTKVDSNGDGLIDLEEFYLLCEGLIGDYDYGDDHGKREEEGDGGLDLKEAFDVFDKDKDGKISVEELGLVLSSLGLKEGKRVEDCKEMIRKVDMDGDGMVDFQEFKKMMKGNNKLVPVF